MIKLNMKLLSLCLSCLVTFSAYSAGISTPAKAEDVPMRLEFYPHNGPRVGSPVTLVLKGKNYPENAWFDEMVAKGAAEPDERFIIDAMSVFKSGTAENALALWAPAEQNRVSELYNDPKQHASNKAYFRQITGSAFLAKILYGSYEIFIVQHDVKGSGSQPTVYTLKKVDGKYYFSNDLESDEVLEYLKHKYAASIPKKNR